MENQSQKITLEVIGIGFGLMNKVKHCLNCEESLSSRGKAPYIHTCRCYCKRCYPSFYNSTEDKK